MVANLLGELFWLPSIKALPDTFLRCQGKYPPCLFYLISSYPRTAHTQKSSGVEASISPASTPAAGGGGQARVKWQLIYKWQGCAEAWKIFFPVFIGWQTLYRQFCCPWEHQCEMENRWHLQTEVSACTQWQNKRGKEKKAKPTNVFNHRLFIRQL